MQTFRLANVLLDVNEFLEGHTDLMFRANPVPVFDADAKAMEFEGTVDFMTYFNALPLAKWRRYTVVENVALHVEAAGDAAELSVFKATSSGGKVVREQVMQQQIPAGDSFCAIDIELPVDDGVLLGFSLKSEGRTRIRNVYYATQVDESVIRPVCIALCTTTFNNEDYILPNVQEVKDKVLGSSEPIAQGFHMYVVDNGRTLDAKEVEGEGVTLCPNPNVGGSGGFARGIIEAMNAPVQFTHVLLMDDDVKVSPESFKRTFNLLSLTNEKYANAFLNGAMLKLQNPNIQFEDVSYTCPSGGYDKYKPELDVSDVDGLVRNETIDVEGPNSYGAWWYSCIPMAAVKEHGLPFPFFVRGDDVEYGVRCKGTYMAMGGICVWHSQFLGRFRASVDGYQYVRNLLVVLSLHDCGSKKGFMLRYWRILHIYLRMINYEAAELWLDGLEDYLKGPEFLATVDGSALMKVTVRKTRSWFPRPA